MLLVQLEYSHTANREQKEGVLTEVEEDIEQRNEESASTHSCCSGNRANLHTAAVLSKHSTIILLLARRNKRCFTKDTRRVCSVTETCRAGSNMPVAAP